MIQRQKINQYRLRGRRSRLISRLLRSERLESREMLAADLMQNPDNPNDVNGDGYTSPLDALLVINELNIAGARSLSTGAPPVQGPMFYDVNGDDYVSPLDALLVLNELNAEGEDGDIVQIRLSVTDTEGMAIDTIGIDQDFQLQAFVLDLTGRDDGGVFAAFTDILYSDQFVSVTGEIMHNEDDYGVAESGDTATPGVIEEVGSASGNTSPLGPSERLLFTVPMTANSNGLANFESTPADLEPAHFVLVYGTDIDVPDPPIVPTDQVSFLSTTLQVGVTETPIAEPDFYTGTIDETLIVIAAEGVLANDTEPNGGMLTANRVDGPSNGSLILNDDGSFEYTPNQGTQADAFTYFASSDAGESSIVSVTIDLVQPNRPPVAVDDDYTTDEDVPHIELDGVLINDSDPDGDLLMARVITSPTNGQLDFTDDDGTFVYTPNAGFSGVDSFTYVANDGQLDSNEATATVTVNEVINRPIAVPDFYDTPVDMMLSVDAANGVLSNDISGEGGDLTAVLVTSATNGDLGLNLDGSFDYTPDPGFSGQDSFTYFADENGTQSDTTTVTIDVLGDAVVDFRLRIGNLGGNPISSISPRGRFLLHAFVEDVSPVPRSGVFAAYMDVFYQADLVGVNGEIIYNDDIYPNQQSGDTSQAGLIDEVGAFDGTVPVGPGEFWLFSVPMIANDLEGVATFESDPADDLPRNDTLLFLNDEPVPTDEINYGSVTLSIVAGDPPVAVDDDYETLEDIPLMVSAVDGVLANDLDPDGDELIAVVISDPSNGELQLNTDGSFVYTPAPNFFGPDTFQYQASDGANFSNTATVTIDVLPVNDSPIAVDDSYRTLGDETLMIDAVDGVLANDIEVEGETLIARLVDDVSDGALLLRDDGSFDYTPTPGFVGQVTFTYQAVAGDDASNIATVSIDVGDLTPSTVRGFVYFDTNNDGVMDENEDRFGDVELTLRGMGVLGNEIFETTRTRGDGSYEFTDIQAGSYVLTEFQPMFILDGKDTVSGSESLRNDRFLINLPPGVVEGDYNFGERGLEPRFINNSYFFASRELDGLWTKVGATGDSQWYSSDEAWDRYETIKVQVSNNNTVAEITTMDSTGFTQSSTVRLSGNHNVTIQSADDGLLLRFQGLPQDHGLTPAPLAADAVDAAFSGDDA